MRATVGEETITVEQGPDGQGRYCFTLQWPVDYIPGHPDGEHGDHMRGQCFHAPIPDRFKSALRMAAGA